MFRCTVRPPCRRASLWIVLLLFLPVAPAAGEEPPWRPDPADWPMFMHDAQNTGATPAVLPLRPLHMRWHEAFWEWTHLWSQPAIVGPDLYLAMMDGVLVHLDAETGEERWRHQAADAIAVTPCVVGDLIVYGDFAGRIVALDRRSGEPRWQVPTDGPIYSSPTYADGLLFVGSNDARLYCLRPSDGEVLWAFETGDMIYSSPAYWDGVVYFASEDMHAYAVNAADGSLRWKHRLFGPCNRSNHPWVAAEAGKVVFCSASNSDAEAGHSQKSTIWMSVPKPWVAEAMGLAPGSNVGHWQLSDPYQQMRLSIRNAIERPELQAYYVFDLGSGQEMRDFTYRPAEGEPIVSPYLPFVCWYNNAARSVLVGSRLYVQDMGIGGDGGVFQVDLATGEFRQVAQGRPHRGDEYTALTATAGVPLAGFMNYVGALDPRGGRRIELWNHSDNRFWYQVPLPPPQLSIWPIDHPDGWQPGMGEYLQKDDQAMREGRAHTRALSWGHFYTGLGTGYGGGSCYGQLIVAGGTAYYPVAGNLICFEPAEGQ